MTTEDHQPLNATPVTKDIARTANNRFGAALSSVWKFWSMRSAAAQNAQGTETRRDMYTVVFFDHNTTVVCRKDSESSPSELLAKAPKNASFYGGTNFAKALRAIQVEINESWASDSYPVIIFMSDGECSIDSSVITEVCETTLKHGKGLAFHTISFGNNQSGRATLREMADTARRVFAEAPEDCMIPSAKEACTYTEAIDTINPPKRSIPLVEDSDSGDDDMVTAASGTTPSVSKAQLYDTTGPEILVDEDVPMQVDPKVEETLRPEEIIAPIAVAVAVAELPAIQPSMDLMDRINGMYRLLDLVGDTAIGGSVDKVLIAQDSIEKLANMVQPNSYSSITKVDFRALDKHAIRPRGIYGSISSIVNFLGEMGLLDAETRSLLLAHRDEAAGANRPFMRPGLYLVDARKVDSDLFYVVFWPEETTWDDDAASSASRNRVTFMRYLKKLCDQLVCLISEEHAQKLVWGDDDPVNDVHIDSDDIEDEDINDRLYAFSVEQTQSQEDSASAQEGFSFQHDSISVSRPRNFPSDLPTKLLFPQVVVGEHAQGILHVEYNEGEQDIRPVNKVRTKKAMEDYLKKHQNPQIQLDDTMSHDSLSILLELGLGARCGGIEDSWKIQCAHDCEKRDRDLKDCQKADQSETERMMNALSISLRFWLSKQAVSFFPTLPEGALLASIGSERTPDQITAEEWNDAIHNVERILSTYSYQHKAISALEVKMRNLTAKGIETKYNTLKIRFIKTQYILNHNPELPLEVGQEFFNLLLSEEDFEGHFSALCASLSPSSAPSQENGKIRKAVAYVGSFIPPWGPSRKPFTLQKVPQRLEIPDDPSFWRALQDEVRLDARYEEVNKLIQRYLLSEIGSSLHKFRENLTKNLRNLIVNQMERNRNKDFDGRKNFESNNAWNNLQQSLQSFLAADIDATRLGHVSESLEFFAKIEGLGMLKSFRLIGSDVKPRKADFRYTFFPMEIKAEDQQAAAMDENHICKPVINERRKQVFEIPAGTSLKLFRLIGKDGCIVILQDSDSLRIFYDSLSTIPGAIEANKHKKLLQLVRLGPDSLITVDETRRHLALLSRNTASLQINIYGYDDKTLASRGGAVDITQWYPGRIPSFQHFLFIPGTDELLLVEVDGTSRIFSLTTQVFRSKRVQLGPSVLSVFATFGGTSLLVLDKDEALEARLRCIHWATFGEQPGVQLPVPAWLSSIESVGLSSIGNRNSNHLMFLDLNQSRISSLFIKITCKSSAFIFKPNTLDAEKVRRRETINNCLIDCHSDVWTRFPIASPIRRESNAEASPHPPTILFVTKRPMPLLGTYFRKMVFDFESRTRKPTDDNLRAISVSTTPQWSPHESSKDISVSRLGDWLVGLMCLIPIHLAVTGSNRFIPLKDGVNTNEFESQLLGASVMQIVQSLSFGWYESIFNSYLADLPVKVVTSMGEQSVGKSYALNHFVDTSFAGSAMRCTEGVWLSVTPTRECLVVAMDFEGTSVPFSSPTLTHTLLLGVQSIERSPQEDMLLVLLNTAVSNYVLFRNNFAISRNIADLFTSFQSCINVLDPASNPKLFQSRLEIIIKASFLTSYGNVLDLWSDQDVIASDTDEMVKEFSLKFDRIVKEEGADNFITQLHKGHLGIIPWPVIESSLFYRLFSSLKKRFMKQPITHPHGGAFLILLKTLMAKLKANDWGALDQNLAAQRSQFLLSALDEALCFGRSDPSSDEPLKNCDNDQIIPSIDNGDILFLPDVKHPSKGEPLDVETCLFGLRYHWSEHLQRYSMTEQEYIQLYRAHLENIVTTRVGLVHEWLTLNTSRFPSSNADISNIFRTFEEKVKELKKYHDGQHNCMTNHKCPAICEFADDHAEGEVPACDMPYV
ncbi:hypothetical protein FRC17_007456 [Serendipita sp. 399]|nr:hypothetical protein FRC17_007456 [Serendipita sp. 399]